MTQSPILRIALPVPLRKVFDYLPGESLDISRILPGMRVKVPFGSREKVGIILSIEQETNILKTQLRKVIAYLDESPLLSQDVMSLISWTADYYQAPIGELCMTGLPQAIRQGKSLPSIQVSSQRSVHKEMVPYTLNEAQLAAVNRVTESLNTFQPFLLDGVTGSGKTEVYMQVIEAVLKRDQQVLVLVPEISLTPQTIQRFKARFNVVVATLHSGLTPKERLHAWLEAKEGSARIVIGTRSAVFTPLPALGAIMVDEEHDASFKQMDRCRYHARDVAMVRAKQANIPIILGSATPSLESLLNIERARYTLLSLPNRVGESKLPTCHMINLHQEVIEEGLSQTLLKNMQITLNANQQVLLFLNRRGFAPILYCTQCMHKVMCKRCDVTMVLHRAKKELRCHHCDAKKIIPTHCEQCGEMALLPVGMGTQRIEAALAKRFPDVPILRIDRDHIKKQSEWDAMLDAIHANPKSILIGTQMLAKGHHFPNVTLVGVLDADAGLFSVDFRAAEHMGQLLTQVIGRSGRGNHAGLVYMQTRYPEHPLLLQLLNEGYDAFAKMLLAERANASLPPYAHMALIRADAYQPEQAEQFLTIVKRWLSGSSFDVTAMGPTPAVISKKKGLHTMHLLLTAAERRMIQPCLRALLSAMEQWPESRKIKWALDVDPIEVT